MGEKPENQTNPVAETSELTEGELENVAGGAAGDASAGVEGTTEGAQGSTQSNVLKTKHDTIKNSISNVG